MASFLAQIAREVQIEIPESQDRQAVPHGKRYTERFFPGGRIDKKAMKNAELAARELVQTIADRFETV